MWYLPDLQGAPWYKPYNFVWNIPLFTKIFKTPSSEWRIFLYVLYILQNLPEMKGKSPWYPFEMYHMYGYILREVSVEAFQGDKLPTAWYMSKGDNWPGETNFYHNSISLYPFILFLPFQQCWTYFFMILHNICLTKETCIVTGSSKTTHYLQHMATRQVSCFFSLKFITKWTSSRYKGKLDKSLDPLHG